MPDKNTAGNKSIALRNCHKKTMSLGSLEFTSSSKLQAAPGSKKSTLNPSHCRKVSNTEFLKKGKAPTYAQLELERRQIVNQFRASPERKTLAPKGFFTASNGKNTF